MAPTAWTPRPTPPRPSSPPLQADLVDPFSGAADSAGELPLAPARWYLTGFLAPQIDRETKDPTADDDFGAATDEEDENEPAPELEPKQRERALASRAPPSRAPPSCAPMRDHS